MISKMRELLEKYDANTGFCNGFAAVKKRELWGYIDEEGVEITDFIYRQAENFNEFGIAIVSYENKKGLLTEEGKIVDRRFFENIKQDEKGNFVCMMKDSHSYIVDEELNIKIQLGEEIEDCYYKYGGMYQIVAGGCSGYIDEKGEHIIPPMYEVGYEFSESGLAYVRTLEGEGGFINKENQFVIGPDENMKDAGVFECGLAPVFDGGVYYFINEKGERVFEEEFLEAKGYAENGLAVVTDMKDICKVIGTDGKEVFRLPKGMKAESFYTRRDLTLVEKEGLFGIINEKGEILLSPNYPKILLSKHGDIHVAYSGANWGYINSRGEKETEFIFSDASVLNCNGYSLVKVDLSLGTRTLYDALTKSESLRKLHDYPELMAKQIILRDLKFYASIVPVRGYRISDDSNLLSVQLDNGYWEVADFEKGQQTAGHHTYLSAFEKGEAIVFEPRSSVYYSKDGIEMKVE